MKFAPVALILCCITLAAHSQTTPSHFKNDLMREKLHGKIATVTEKEFNAAGDSLQWKGVVKYNSIGNRQEFVTYSPSGEVLSRTTYKYDDSARLIEENRYKADGSLNVKTTCKYDDRWNKIEEDNYDPGGILFLKVLEKYDAKGNRLVRDDYNEFGSLFLKRNAKFDDDGNEASAREYDSHKGLKFSTTYEYDNADGSGNWLRRVTYKNDEPFSVTEREISYQ